MDAKDDGSIPTTLPLMELEDLKDTLTSQIVSTVVLLRSQKEKRAVDVKGTPKDVQNCVVLQKGLSSDFAAWGDHLTSSSVSMACRRSSTQPRSR